MRMGIGMGTQQGPTLVESAKSVGTVKSRLLSNQTGTLNIPRHMAYYYIASDYTSGGVAHKLIYKWQHNKNMATLDSLFIEGYSETAAAVTDSSTHSNKGALASDDNSPIGFSDASVGYLAGNHGWAYLSSCTITYDGDLGSYDGGSQNNPITVNSALTSDINGKLMDLIGRTDVKFTIGGADKDVVVIGVFPAQYNYTSDELKKITILFVYGHGSSTSTNWAYEALSCGSMTGIKVNGSTLDLTLGSGGDTKTVSSYASGPIVNSRAGLHSGNTGYANWFYYKHTLSTRQLSTEITNNNADDLLIPVRTTPAGSTIFSDAMEFVEITQNYQVHNIYLLVNAIIAARAVAAYTYDEATFIANNYNDGYYGNPNYNKLNYPMLLMKDVYRYLGYGLIEQEQDVLLYEKFGIGYIGGIQAAKLASPDITGGTITPITYSYIPNSTDRDKINNYSTSSEYNLTSANAYEGTVPDRSVQLTAWSKTTDQARANRGVFFQVIGYNPVYGDTVPTLRRTNNTKFLNIAQTSGKYYPHAIDVQASMDVFVEAGTAFKARSYRQCLPSGADSDISGKATAVYWCFNESRTKIYLYLDYHRDVTNDVVTLPTEFQSLQFSVHDSNNGVTVSGSSPSRQIGIGVSTTVANQINADGTILLTTSGTGDTVYSGTPTAATAYDLSSTDDPMPIGGIPNGNLAWIILEIR